MFYRRKSPMYKVNENQNCIIKLTIIKLIQILTISIQAVYES